LAAGLGGQNLQAERYHTGPSQAVGVSLYTRGIPLLIAFWDKVTGGRRVARLDIAGAAKHLITNRLILS
jgi:hypothetical protein